MTGTESAEDRFASLYRRHYNEVLAYISRRAQGVDPADVVANTFLVAWRKIDEAMTGGLPWLYRTASFELQNELRGKSREQRLVRKLSAEPDKSTSPDHADSYTEREAVTAALKTLSSRDRELLLLVEWEQLDVRSAAMVVGCSHGAARVRIHRARRHLAAIFSPSADGDSKANDKFILFPR